MKADADPGIGAGLTFLLAATGGVVVANLYYAQPLLLEIGETLGIPPAAAGIAMTVTQVGYGLGLLLVVPLGDRFENRRLIVAALGVLTVALVGAGLAPGATVFLLSALALGLSASVAQIVVPYAAHLAHPHQRGRIVGNVMSGLLLGMMLARPISSLVADMFGWRSIFLVSAALVALFALGLWRFIPRRHPGDGFRYRELFASLTGLLRTKPVLRRRALVQFCLFGAFTLFWTTAPILLLAPPFSLTQKEVAVFALIGVTGAGAAPLVGRLADRGLGGPAAAVALIAAVLGFLLCFAGEEASPRGLAMLVVAGILLDCGVASSLVLSQRTILALGTQARSRLNGLFFAIFYSGGAVGSAVGAWAVVTGGWMLSTSIGLAMTLIALLLHVTGRHPEPISLHDGVEKTS